MRIKVYPNLLAKKRLTTINQAWVADITYIGILKQFVFLAALLDRYSRKVIGWAISKQIDAELCLAALKSARQTRQPPPGCIHHSDRGVQYAYQQYIALLEQAKMQISISSREVYHSKRLHSALGYLAPIEYEMEIQLTQTADRASLNSR
jgi:putative transposase